ncbi:efflux RND transporter periplasmic adaptor subunit [Methylocapsa sp. S129]|uniref:efflux RND transporter periplasmic adaptor subunit n=1 Tax=Methylocapsa sp. S129 TaxID=1641869 RepID=UPI001FEE71DA|nr:efflux RND transporter periplasmic adaptor subunit [Methylocapsa sp. S129]
MNRILLALVVLAAAVGGAASSNLFKLPFPAAVLFVLAGVLALLLVLRLLPLGVRRPVVFLLTLAILAGLGGGLYYFQFVIKPDMVKGFISAAFAPKPSAVSAEPAKMEKWTPQMPAIGSLRAYQGIDIAPQVAGVISAIHFKSSDDVAAGAPLLQIDDSVDQADLKNGMAQLRNADATLERQQTLVQGGNTAKSQVDSAVAARDSAAATVERTRAIIAQKALAAPFAGRLGISKVDVGQFLAVGTSVVTLQQLDPIYVDFQSPEQSLRTLAVGQQATMTLDAFPDRTFTGKIAAIDARISQDTRNLLVRAEFPNPDHKLLPGMFANIAVTTGAPADVLTLPRTAIIFSLYGDNVFVVKPAPPKASEAQAAGKDDKPNLIAERRFVRVGDTRGERVSILEGVNAGELVVTSGQIKLQPNGPVTIDSTAGLPTPAQTPKP